MDTILFKSRSGDVGMRRMKEALRAADAAECDVLYIHTDMTFGLPAMKRGELLAALLDCLESLGVRTLVFPAFTFSFCNNEPFDARNSRTPMGALNEYARRTGRGVRSADPLLSIYALGDPLDLTENLGPSSIGENSSYDRLHKCGREVRFLFFGADMRECFTYTHYMEAIIGVPYRYDREFTGTIIDGAERREARALLYSSYANCRLNPRPVVYEAMKARNQLRVVPAGDGSLCCFREAAAFETISDLLHRDRLCLTDGTFDPAVKDETYNPAGERIVSVR